MWPRKAYCMFRSPCQVSTGGSPRQMLRHPTRSHDRRAPRCGRGRRTACSDHLAKFQPAEALGKCFAIRRGLMIAEHHDVAAEGVLHVPRWIADTRLEVEPCLPQQCAQQPRIDVAAMVVAHVDDESLAIEH